MIDDNDGDYEDDHADNDALIMVIFLIFFLQ